MSWYKFVSSAAMSKRGFCCKVGMNIGETIYGHAFKLMEPKSNLPKLPGLEKRLKEVVKC